MTKLFLLLYLFIFPLTMETPASKEFIRRKRTIEDEIKTLEEENTMHEEQISKNNEAIRALENNVKMRKKLKEKLQENEKDVHKHECETTVPLHY